eukprot:XP_022274814.1 uncharacterized protein COX4I1 isoform X2 [Canis lupus familiaris]
MLRSRRGKPTRARLTRSPLALRAGRRRKAASRRRRKAARPGLSRRSRRCPASARVTSGAASPPRSRGASRALSRFSGRGQPGHGGRSRRSRRVAAAGCWLPECSASLASGRFPPRCVSEHMVQVPPISRDLYHTLTISSPPPP